MRDVSRARGAGMAVKTEASLSRGSRIARSYPGGDGCEPALLSDTFIAGTRRARAIDSRTPLNRSLLRPLGGKSSVAGVI